MLDRMIHSRKSAVKTIAQTLGLISLASVNVCFSKIDNERMEHESSCAVCAIALTGRRKSITISFSWACSILLNDQRIDLVQ
jgi:hypothetical protein